VKSKRNVGSYGVRVEQNLFHGGGDRAALREVDLQIKARWSAYRATEQKVLREASALYFEALAKGQEVNDLKALLGLREECVKIAREKHDAGAEMYLDYSQALAALAETKAKLAKAEAELVYLRTKFEEITGYRLPVRLEPPEMLINNSLTREQCVAFAMKHNPNVQAASDKHAAAKAAVAKPNAKLLPSVDLSCSFDQSRDSARKGERESPNNNHRGYSIALNARYPLYDGGVGRSEKRQAKETAVQTAVELHKIKNETKNEVETAYIMVEAARASRASIMKAMEAREVALKNTCDERQAGTKIMGDELKAQQDLHDTKLAKTQAEKDLFNNQCGLAMAMGSSLLEKRGYDCAAHYNGVTKRMF
jgi:outer membrane protein